MKSKVLKISFLIAVALTAMAVLWPGGTVRAQRTMPPDWSGVQVVAYQNGVTGFFDTNTGTLFLYDVSVSRPILIRQIDQLGRPMRRLLN